MITFVVGTPGAGKTLLLTHLATYIMRNQGYANYRMLKRENAQLNNNGYNLSLPPQKHLVYADYDISITRKLQAYSISGYEIGLANPYFYTTYIPAYATIFLDEAQRYYDSRMSRYLRDDVYHWYQIHRHNDYNVYMSCQRLANIDVNIRALGGCFLVIDKLNIDKDEYGFFRKITWTVRKFHSCDTAEQYTLARDTKQKCDMGTVDKIVADYDVSRYYNTKSCKPAFYAGLETADYQYYVNAGYTFSAESFVDYNNTHAFSAPIGYWKNTDYDKQILKQIGVTSYGN